MTDADRAFSAQILGYWTRFAATADPDGGGAVTWPRRTSEADTYLELGEPIRSSAGLDAAHCDAIEARRVDPAGVDRR